MKLKFLIAFTLVNLSTQIFAATVIGISNVKVKGVSCSNSAGFCRVTISELQSKNTGCSVDSVAYWAPSSPVGKEFMAIALSAFTTGKSVYISTASVCFSNGFAALDYIELMPN